MGHEGGGAGGVPSRGVTPGFTPIADEKEENILGSIPLLSFRVAAVQPSDNISRKHTFKVSACAGAGGGHGATAAVAPAWWWHWGGTGDAGGVLAALVAFLVAVHGARLG